MTRTGKLLAVAVVVSSALLAAQTSFSAETKGTLTHPKATVALKYAYLVKGPDAVDAAKIIRRLVLTDKDMGAAIQACTAMDCVDGALKAGMIADLDGGPRLNYWMVLNGGLIQYSGSDDIAVLKAATDQPKQLAGKLSFDDSKMGGPKVDADFDAALVKEFTKAR